MGDVKALRGAAVHSGNPAIPSAAPSGATPPPPSTAPWWARASDIRASLLSSGPPACAESFFRLGRGFLSLKSADRSLWTRFREIYRGCEVAAGEARGGPGARCVVRAAHGVPAILASFDGPETPDFAEFTLAVFADRGYREAPSQEAGWRLIVEPGLRAGPVAAARGAECLADSGRAWQSLVGSHAVNSVLRLQSDMIFLHAGSVSVADRGALLAGAKGSGKSTLTLALAERGCGFLGDEVAAVDSRTWEILPFRRAVSIRRGPGAAGVLRRLEEMSLPPESFPDGSERIRAHVDDMFPRAGGDPAPLRCVFFLGEPGPRLSVREISPRASDLRRLTPLAGTLWRRERGRAISALLRLLSRARCFTLDPGDPDETADWMVKTMEVS